jgi:hypothetical protein
MTLWAMCINIFWLNYFGFMYGLTKYFDSSMNKSQIVQPHLGQNIQLLRKKCTIIEVYPWKIWMFQKFNVT